MSNHRPENSVLFLGLLVLGMYLTPILTNSEKENIQETQEVPSWSELIDTLSVEVEIPIDTSFVVQNIDNIEDIEIDSSRWTPDYAIHNTTTLPDSLRIYSTDSSLTLLHMLFAKLEQLSTDSAKVVDIFHFGDSQIEGDRITGRIRSSWQKSWGGTGPGLIPAIENVPALSVRQETTGIWDRYTRFGTVDSTLEHSCYGPMAVFSRVYDKGQITLKPHPRGFRTNKEFHSIRVFTGSSTNGGKLKISGSVTAEKEFTIPPALIGEHRAFNMKLSGKDEKIDLVFDEIEVDVTGIDLGSENGVKFHNIPMRGSAGMLFKKLNSKHFTNFMSSFEPGMLILQFGGNAAPYLNDSNSVAKYANRFAGQLRYLRVVWPKTPLLVIGPSDMGTSEDYPMVDNIIAEFKRVSLEEGCLFWDLKAAQGGDGAMTNWSKESPALASSDLVHFTPKGAKEISKLLDTALRAEYKSWVEWKR